MPAESSTHDSKSRIREAHMPARESNDISRTSASSHNGSGSVSSLSVAMKGASLARAARLIAAPNPVLRPGERRRYGNPSPAGGTNGFSPLLITMTSKFRNVWPLSERKHAVRASPAWRVGMAIVTAGPEGNVSYSNNAMPA